MSTNITLSGTDTYSINPGSNTVALTVNEIDNNSSTYTSGTLRLELWLTLTPWNSSGSNTGWEIATDQLTGSSNGTLGPNQHFSNISDTVAYLSHPPAGTYYITLAVGDYTGTSSLDNGYTIDTFLTFPNYLVVANNGGLSQGVAISAPPTLAVVTETLSAGTTLPAAGLIASVKDPAGNAIAQYDFRDDGGGAGHFTLNGVQQSQGVWINVSASTVSALQWVSGSTAATETVDVAAWDGSNWSNTATTTITTTAIAPPTLAVQNATVAAGASIAASSLITAVMDPGGYSITRYEFYDNGGGAGYFTVNGVHEQAGTWFNVTAANLSTVQYVGTAAGTESVQIADGDTYGWSAYATASIVTQSSSLPTITVSNQTVSGSNFIQASTLIGTATAPAGTSITYYDFRDDGGGGGYFTLGGVKQSTGSWITVAASQLPSLLYVGSNTGATETVDVAAWDGTDWSHYSTATITTTTAALPVIVVQNETVAAGSTTAASKLITSASDPSGHAITQYDFRDDGGGGGSLTLNGVQQTQGAWINVAASSLASLQYVASGQPASETIDVAAWNGTTWSYYKTATITTAGVSLPVITLQNATLPVGQTIQASSLITSASDPGGAAITYYDFRDDGGGAGYFTLNGAVQAQNSWITVTAANLASLKYVGTTAGAETVDVADWNGTTWSYYSTATITTSASAGLPVVTVQPESTITGVTIAASSLIVSASDPGGKAIAAYEFKDDGGGAGYFTVSGTKQAAGSFFQVAASALSTVQFVATGPGSEAVEVGVSNGTSWSYSQSTAISITTPVAPVIAAQNLTITANGTLAASSLVYIADVSANATIVTYGFRDDGGGAGYFTVNGVKQATGSIFQVAASALSSVAYVSGSASATESFEVQAYNNQAWSSFSSGTIVTQGTQQVTAPVVTSANQTLTEGATIQASQMVASTTHPNGTAIGDYTFNDSGVTGAYISVNGIKQVAGSAVVVTAAQLANVTYTAGNTAGSDMVKIQFFDGLAWSNTAQAQVATTAPVVQLPGLTVQSETVNAGATIQASSLIASTSDPAGYAITSYDLRDDGGTGGHFALNGVAQATNTVITVSASQLSQLTYVGGSGAGSETVDIAVYDGHNWSNYATTSITTTPAAALPVVTVQNETVTANGSLQVSSLITSSTAGITSFNVRDDGGGAGYLTLNGTQEATGTWVTVSAATLSTLKFVAGANAGTETVDVEVNTGGAWSNYATSTITVTGASSANSVIAKLVSPGIQADATKFIVNNSLSYTGMLTILQDVAAQGTVTATEFSDLKTLVSSFNVAGGVTVSAPLYAISNSLVNGDAANATWTGGSQTSVALGNLKAGSSQTVVNELIGKWFLGTDMPAPVFAGDLFSQAPGETTYYGTYVASTNPLYNNTGAPATTDLNQGTIGDCYFLASLISIAQDQPQAIENAITYNGNNTYTVRFYVNGTPTYVTVNNELPIDKEASGVAYQQNVSLGNDANDLWASLMEKAYVQLNQEPNATGSWHPTGNAYWMIDGGDADPITQITGRSVASYGTDRTQSLWDSLRATVIAALQNKQEVLFGTDQTTATKASNGQDQLVGGHMYCTLTYDSSTGNFELQNPWGSLRWGGGTPSYQVTFEDSWDQLYAAGGEIYVASAGASSAAAPGVVSAPSNAASAVALFASGKLTVATAINDSATNVAANIDQLSAMQAAGLLSQVTLTDSGTPTLAVTGTQLTSDLAVLATIAPGNYNLSVTGASSAATATDLNSALIADLVSPLSVNDSAANVQVNLDGLQLLAAAGKLSAISLTDSGIPTLSMGASELSRDAAAIGKLTGYFTLNVSADQPNQSIAGPAGHGTTVSFTGTAASYTVTPAGDGVGFTISNAGSTDHLSNITALQFSDFTAVVAQTPGTTTITGGNITELYGAVFGRTPDVAGLAYYQAQLQANPALPLTLFAQDFLASPEYQNNSAHNYAQSSAGDAQFITDSYTNLLHRSPEAAAIPYYQAIVNLFTQGLTPGSDAYKAAQAMGHAIVITDFSQSAEFLGDVQITAQQPADKQHFLILI